jgi:predicted nucleic acid-binding Zn ribbon protein
LISGGAGLIFKGSGFYITDYKKKTESADNKGTTPKSAKESPKITE